MEKQSFFKPFKSIFSLLLSICIVFCGLATTAFAAEADETTVLVEGQVYTLPVGSYTFNPTQDGWYKFESTNGGDPCVKLIINDGSTDSYEEEDDDGGIDVNFKCFVDITSSDVVTIELSNFEDDDTTPITFSIEYRGVDEPDDMGDPDNDYNDDYDGDATYVSANGFTAQVIDETTCRITNIEDSAVVDGVLTIPQAIEDYTVVGFDYWIDLYNGSITVINLPSTVSGDLPFDSLYNLTAVNVPEDSTSFKSINGVVYNKALTEVVLIPNDFSGVFYIPAGVETFDYTNLNVTGFEIEQGNKYFSMKNGILCNLDGTVLRKATPSAPTEFVLKANMFVEPACFAGTKLQKVTIDSNVTNISYAVFAGCTELKSVVIPGSVKAIGSSAFSGCTKLETVTINNGPTTIGSYAFQDCKALKSIVIPNSVKTIENKAFDCCSSLASATLGSGLKKICFKAFANCDSLLSIVIPNSVTEIENGVFESCDKLATVKIGTGLKEITGGAFYGCKSLKSLSISNSVTTIEYEAFDGCTSLASVKIPDSVKNICYRAFADCTALASISIGKGVTYIDEGAFANTKYYNTSSNWVQKVLYIGNYLIEAKDDISGAYSIKNGTKCIATAAFSDCGTLKTVTMPSTLVSICDNAFTNCKTLTKAIIPASVKILGDYIFTGCKSLKIVSDKDTTSEVVTTPKSVTTITYDEFMGCESVKKVVIPYGVKAISPFAFSGCKSLTSITIPSSVKTIGYSSFDDCNSLKKVTIPSSVTEIAYRSFGYVYSYDDYSTTISKVAGFTIEGKKGSSAEQYAKENGFNFVERKLTLATPTASSANTSKGIKVTWNKVSNAETYAVYQ
ncbi:MAG: leucine-rich repeat domain-containing protein, partial [Clostridia bacterium]|nr:leucine-rich repeat domain-containing protein [Clostridia bacterium]